MKKEVNWEIVTMLFLVAGGLIITHAESFELGLGMLILSLGIISGININWK